MRRVITGINYATLYFPVHLLHLIVKVIHFKFCIHIQRLEVYRVKENQDIVIYFASLSAYSFSHLSLKCKT